MSASTKTDVRAGPPAGPVTGRGSAGGGRGATAVRRPGRSRAPRMRRRGIALVLTVLVLVAGLVFLFFYSAAFVVQEVRVAGVKGEVAESVERLAQIPNGRPLARVSERRVNERVLQDLRVAGVTVDKKWPSTVTLRPTLREPALVLKQGSALWVADAGGVVYDEVAKAPKKLPVVTVPARPTELGADTVRGLAELWESRPKKKALEGQLSAPRLDDDGVVTMKVDGLTIVWGPPVEAEKKWQIVEALVAQDSVDPTGGIPQTIDLSLPDTPVVTGIPAAPQD